MFGIEAIEQGFITALEPLKDEGLRTLETYGGQLNHDDLEKAAINYPAIFVWWGGAESVKSGGMKQDLVCDVSLLVCDRDLRGDASARSGVYAWLGRARDIFRDKLDAVEPVVSGWTPPMWVKEGVLAYSKKRGTAKSFAVYEAVYRMMGAF